MKYLLSGLTAAWLAATSVHGQIPSVERLSFSRGVSHDLVYCLMKDRRGFLWIGTMYGLVRYDGHLFVSFRHDPSDTTTLSNDDIVSLYEDQSGTIWVGTYAGGVNRYDPVTGRFARFLVRDTSARGRDIVWSVAGDSAGRIWLGTQDGVEGLDPSTGTRERTGVTASIRTLLMSTRQRLWIGTTEDGLRVIDLLTGHVTICRSETDAPHSLSGNRISGLVEDRRGRIWISTLDGGLTVFEEGVFRSLTGAPRRIQSMVLDASGRLWLGTFGGIFRVEEDGTAVLAVPDTKVGKNLIALSADPSGALWVGTYLDGVSLVSFAESSFRVLEWESGDQPAVRSLCVLRSNGLLMGTDRGLFMSDSSRGTMVRQTWYDRLTAQRSRKIVNAVLEDRSRAVWVGTPHGLYRRDPHTRSVRFFAHDEDDSLSLSHSSVNCLMEGRDGSLWIGTANGLNRFDASSGRFERFVGSGQGLSSDYILSLFEDSRHQLWIGTYGGTDVWSADRRRVAQYIMDPYDPSTISNNYALSFFEDPSGVWIGTAGGLNRVDGGGILRHWTTLQGLPNSVVAGIAGDERGRLWLSTHHGLVCFNPQRETMLSYEQHDGLPGNMFAAGAFGSFSDGRPVFGALEGVVVVERPPWDGEEEPPAACLTEFRLLTEGSGGNRHTSALPSRIQLDHDENFFVLGFTVADFQSAGRNRFAYRLVGADPDWIETSDRQATYTALAPGSYEFQVKAGDRHGRWSRTHASVRVDIDPPWWRTGWFAVLAIASTLWLARWWHRTRIRQRVRRTMELEQVRREERERVRRKAASDFHDELGHRLTKIGLFSEIVKRTLKPSDPDVQVYLDKIIDDAEHLGHETRDFIWSLDPEQDSLYDFVEYLRDFGNELFDRTGTAFTVDTSVGRDEPWKLPMDRRRQITLVVKEAMNNALRHSEAARVALSVRVADGALILELADNGHGFRPPVQIEGHGLPNMRKRAESVDASFELRSEPGQGTSVRLVVSRLERSEDQPREQEHAV